MKRITLILMALLTITTAFSQTTRSKGASIYPGSTSTRGDDWEVFEFGGNTYNYFKGNAAVDELTTEKLLGFHWKGSKYNEHLNEEIYLCNMQTGEYLQIGDLWGENGMTSHVGIPYKIIPGTSTRRWGTLSDMSSGTYWIQPLDVRQERVIGRSAVGGSGAENGHFEYNRHLFLRTQQEYHGDSQGTSTHPGGLLFKFQEYTVDGQTCYIIYTHRKTNGQTGNWVEFGNRDSYLLLTSVGATSTADFNNVRFKKFAGQMYGPTTVTLSDQTDLDAITDDATAKSTAAHKYGTYDNADHGTTFTTNATSGLAGVTVSITNGTLGAGKYDSNGYFTFNHTMEFYPPAKDAGTATLTITAPTGYVITAYNVKGVSKNGGGRQFKVVTPRGSTFDWIYGADGRCNITESGYNVSSISLTLSTTSGSDTNTPLCFPQFSVTLKRAGETFDVVNATSNASENARLNRPMGDEIPYYDAGTLYVSLENGLAAASGNKENLWKIVTKKERDRYRIVASDAKPVDVSSRIFNSKFNTSYIYNIAYENCNDTDGDGHWVANQTDLHPDYGWTWYNRDASTHPTTPHVHPWPTTPNENTKESTLDYRKGKEFHKVGTGRFWRFSERNATNDGYIGGHDNDMQEMNITHGVDANYCGSIYEGSANLQQTITGLRAGNYIVYVRGFFAPHDMEKYL
ncbi:MAG: hypothetical protein IK120_08990, partial [Muribaculaceae bacterium]|nr:hypothetical protein [Muribaculaceae bacterium]